MTINHHNYESWLLQYVDNELTPAEREAVEAFVAENPEAKDLLEDFKQVVLQPDLSLTMPGKAQLLQPELWNATQISNQQEQLLLLADEALPAKEKILLLAEIEKSPLLQKEWNLLKKSRLAKEKPHAMPGKEDLLRYPMVFSINYRRILQVAVAAAILGFGLFFANRFGSETVGTEGAQIVQNIPSKKDTSTGKLSNNQTGQKPETAVAKNIPEQAPEQTSGNNTAVSGDTKSNTAKANNTNTPNLPALKVMPDKQQEIPQQMLMAAVLPEEKSSKNMETVLPNKNLGIQEVGVETSIAVSLPDADQYANPLVESEIESTATEIMFASDLNEEEDEIIHIAGAPFSKQKLRNVYRNVTRPIARALGRSGDDKSGRK